MTDYSAVVYLSRDDIANMLSDELEQTSYVLAEFAGSAAQGTMTRDDFVDSLEQLDDKQKADLVSLAHAIVRNLAQDE